MEHSSHLPDWEEYKAMSREEKAALAKAIGTETGMDYKGIVRYSRWGTELETALYQKEVPAGQADRTGLEWPAGAAGGKRISCGTGAGYCGILGRAVPAGGDPAAAHHSPADGDDPAPAGRADSPQL